MINPSTTHSTILTMVAVLAACSGPTGEVGSDTEGSSDTDTGSDASDDEPGVPPPAPAAPALPAAPDGPAASTPPDLACADGWRVVSSVVEGESDPAIDYTTCAPYPAEDPAECPLGQAHFVGTEGCAPVGDPCPVDEWPAGVDRLDDVIYVDDDALGVGLGNTPVGALTTIGAALAMASPGTTIAIAKGTYDEVVDVPDGVTLLGACAAETLIQPTSNHDRASSLDGVLRPAAGATAIVEELSIVGSGTTLVGVTVGDAQTLVARGLVVSSAFDGGVIAWEGSTLTADGLVVTDTRPFTDGTEGYGLIVAGGQAEVARGVLVDNHEAGVIALGPATLVLTDVAVMGTQPAASGEWGVGMVVDGGAQVEVTRSSFDRNHGFGILAGAPGTTVALADVVVQRTEPAGGGYEGIGLSVVGEATAQVERSTFAGNRRAGISAEGSGTGLSLTDVVVVGTMPTPEGDYGRGLEVLGANVEVLRATFDDNQDAGVLASSYAELVLTDLAITRTKPGQIRYDGVGGLQVRDGASATITRATLDANEDVAIHASDVGTVVVLTDVVARNTQPGPEDLGYGVLAEFGASVAVTRVALEHGHHVGVFALDEQTEVVGTDLAIVETSPAPTEARGWGLRTQGGAQVSVERVMLDQNHELGIFARDPGTRVVLSDLVVQGTQPGSDGRFGSGLLAFAGARVEATRAMLDGNYDLGVFAHDYGTEVVLMDVTVMSTQPGLEGSRGWGLALQGGARMEVTRGAIVESKDFGIFVHDGDLALQDVRIASVVERACIANSTCPPSVDWDSGMGLAVLDDAAVTGQRVEVDTAALCGMMVSPDRDDVEGPAPDLVLGLTESTVHHSAIGVCDQIGGLEPGQGLYLDPETNGVTIETTGFAPPPRAEEIQPVE